MDALRHVPAKSSLSSSDSMHVKKSLRFATFLNYPACIGYRYPATTEEISIIQNDAGYDLQPDERLPPLRRAATNRLSLEVPQSRPDITALSPPNSLMISIQFGTVTSPSCNPRDSVAGGNQNLIFPL